MNQKDLENKIMEKYNSLLKTVNSEEYDGYSNFYYYASEDMPRELSALSWTINELLDDVISMEFKNEMNKLLIEFKY